MADTGLHAFDTPRLHLRPLGEGDEAIYCRLYTDADLMRHIAAPMTPEAALRSFAVACRQQSPQKQRWIIHELPHSLPLGLVALFVDGDAGEMGIMLIGDAQGRGMAVEAMAAVRDRAFARPELRRLWIRQQPGNRAVNRMMARLGFTELPPDPALPLELRWEVARDAWRAARQESGATGAIRLDCQRQGQRRGR